MGNLGWYHLPSVPLEVMVRGCRGRPCYAVGDIWLPTLPRICWCSCSLACNHHPSIIFLVEFYQGWCGVQDINSPQEDKIANLNLMLELIRWWIASMHDMLTPVITSKHVHFFLLVMHFFEIAYHDRSPCFAFCFVTFKLFPYIKWDTFLYWNPNFLIVFSPLRKYIALRCKHQTNRATIFYCKNFV